MVHGDFATADKKLKSAEEELKKCEIAQAGEWINSKSNES